MSNKTICADHTWHHAQQQLYKGSAHTVVGKSAVRCDARALHLEVMVKGVFSSYFSFLFIDIRTYVVYIKSNILHRDCPAHRKSHAHASSNK